MIEKEESITDVVFFEVMRNADEVIYADVEAYSLAEDFETGGIGLVDEKSSFGVVLVIAEVNFLVNFRSVSDVVERID